MKKFLVIAATLAIGLSISFAEGDAAKAKAKADPAKSAESFIKKSDKDGNGTLSKEEFAASPRGVKLKEKGDGAVDKAFSHLDKDKDGQISKDELVAASQKGGKGKAAK